MSRYVVLALLIVGGALFAIPFLWTISTALKTPEEIAQDPTRLIPAKIAWENFPKAWTALPFTQFVLNTLFITLVNTVGSTK